MHNGTRLSEYDFYLPERLIALRPAQPRTSARLLVAMGTQIQGHSFADLGQFLRPGDRLVLNDTKVIPARLQGVRHRLSAQGETSVRAEVTLLSCDPSGHWQAMAKPGKRLAIGEIIKFPGGLEAQIHDKFEGQLILNFNLQGPAFDQAISRIGSMPLPPYIASKRAPDAQDISDYQSVFAKNSGAVAAPTASLHFEQAQLNDLVQSGIDISTVTLHVGAGTFLPVKQDDLRAHKMHAEWGEISTSTADEIMQTITNGGRIIPVGTTALRLLETAAIKPGQITPWRGETDIFIYPGFKFKITDALLTNFHLPRSTLLMLVSALMGRKSIKNIYQHAITQNYRFFSYGDASLLLPEQKRA